MFNQDNFSLAYHTQFRNEAKCRTIHQPRHLTDRQNASLCFTEPTPTISILPDFP